MHEKDYTSSTGTEEGIDNPPPSCSGLASLSLGASFESVAQTDGTEPPTKICSALSS